MNNLETPITITQVVKNERVCTQYTFELMNWIIHKEVSLVINFYGDDTQPLHCLHTVVVKIEGDEYQQWGDDDSYIESIVQRELQKIHAETAAAETPAAE
jgi:hypothetical protein